MRFSLLIAGGAVCLGEAMLFDDEDIFLRKGMSGQGEVKVV